MSIKKYWMVHKAEGGQAPNKMHTTKHEAETEAKRLAKVNPNKVYSILEVVSAFCTMENPVVEVDVIGDNNGS
jgi:hypothetical protein